MGSGEHHTTSPIQLDMDATTVLWMVRHPFTLTITHPEEVLQVMKSNFLMRLSLVEPCSSSSKKQKKKKNDKGKTLKQPLECILGRLTRGGRLEVAQGVARGGSLRGKVSLR